MADGRVFIRLLASNRELTGSALIKYVREKCTSKTHKVEKSNNSA